MSQNQFFIKDVVDNLSSATVLEETSHEYHLQILHILSLPTSEPYLYMTSEEALLEIMKDTKFEAGIRSAAFATCLTLLWRWRSYQQFRQVFDSYHDIFVENSPSLVALYRGMYDLSQISKPGGRQQALLSAQAAKESMPDTPSALNLFTEVVATRGERGLVSDEELEEGRTAIDKAIDIDPKYAKYYANRARILSLQGIYDDAHQNIDKAIEIEPFDKYMLWRVYSYESIRVNISLQQRSAEINVQSKEMKQEQERAREQLSSTRGETLTLLGLLAAVIAFVVPSVQFLGNLQSIEAGIMMTFMAGLILVVFGSFMELIQPGERWRWKGILVVVIGILLAVIAGIVSISTEF